MTTVTTKRAPKVKNKTREDTGLAIIGPYGSIWTDRLFESAEEAKSYITAFWCRTDQKIDFSKWFIVPASSKISISKLPLTPLGKP